MPSPRFLTALALTITWLSYLLLYFFPTPLISAPPSSASSPQSSIKAIRQPSRFPSSASALTNDTWFPVRRDGVIFITHGMNKVLRETAFALTKQGFQVLLGVKNKAERRSFLYSMQKGLELIDFDIQDPSTYPPLVYRLREMRQVTFLSLVRLLVVEV